MGTESDRTIPFSIFTHCVLSLSIFLSLGPSQQPADIRTSLLDGKNNGGQQLKDPLAKRDSYASFEVRQGGREEGREGGKEGERGKNGVRGRVREERRDGGRERGGGREGGRERREEVRKGKEGGGKGEKKGDSRKREGKGLRERGLKIDDM